jgi:hypothetical protein
MAASSASELVPFESMSKQISLKAAYSKLCAKIDSINDSIKVAKNIDELKLASQCAENLKTFPEKFWKVYGHYSELSKENLRITTKVATVFSHVAEHLDTAPPNRYLEQLGGNIDIFGSLKTATLLSFADTIEEIKEVKTDALELIEAKLELKSITANQSAKPQRPNRFIEYAKKTPCRNEAPGKKCTHLKCAFLHSATDNGSAN